MFAMGVVFELDKALADQIGKIARRRKKSREKIIAEALNQYVEDAEDYARAVQAYRKGGKRTSLNEVITRHDLAG
jgi:predicted transcriptional regulator